MLLVLVTRLCLALTCRSCWLSMYVRSYYLQKCSTEFNTSAHVRLFFFFFQAEDGIRDHCVTGVQTWCSSDLSSGNDDVQATLDYGGEQFQHGLGQGFVLEHVARGDRIPAKAADGEAGSVEGQGRNDGVDARAILQAGIHHPRRFNDAAPSSGDNTVDDPHLGLIIL